MAGSSKNAPLESQAQERTLHDESKIDCSLIFVSCRPGNLLQCTEINVIKYKTEIASILKNGELWSLVLLSLCRRLFQRQVMARDQRKSFVLS